MPRPETSHRNQKAVYWPAPEASVPSDFDRYGEPKASTRVELDVRIVRGRHEASDAHGNRYAADAEVHVDREVPLGSTLWFGEVDDLPSDLSTLTDLYQVVRYNETPDAKGRRYYRTVSLMRLGNEVPVTA